MTKFDAKPLVDQLEQLYNGLFGTAQDNMHQIQEEFVNAFENHNVDTQQLAYAFVQLSACRKHINQTKEIQDSWKPVADQVHHTHETLLDIHRYTANAKEKQIQSTIDEEYHTMLERYAAQRNANDQEIQRQADKLESEYAKKMRESTFQNLVGAERPHDK